MSHRPGFELSKQVTRKDFLKAVLPINQEKREQRRIQITVSFQSLQHLTWALCGTQVSGAFRVGNCPVSGPAGSK